MKVLGWEECLFAELRTELTALRARIAELEQKNRLLSNDLKAVDAELDDTRVNLTITSARAVAELRAERDALRARIKETEEQGPVGWTTQLALDCNKRSPFLAFEIGLSNMWGAKGEPLYLKPTPAQSTALDNLTRDAEDQGLYEDKP